VKHHKHKNSLME